MLRKLKLTLSNRKTSMGSLVKKGFHYLGINHEATRIPHEVSVRGKEALQTKTQAVVTLHPRSCHRALDKVKAMRDNAVHPAIREPLPYPLCSLAASHEGLQSQTNLRMWVNVAEKHSAADGWLGSGLLGKSVNTSLSY